MASLDSRAEPISARRNEEGVPTAIANDGRGRDAESPTKIPARGWKDVFLRVKAEAKADHASLLAAGVALYGLLALVPALIALISVYGLVADPQKIDDQLASALTAAPAEVRTVISQQVRDIGNSSSGAILAVIGGTLLALWSASAGVKNLIEAINVAYDEDETRGFIKLRAVSLAFTVGVILFLVVAFGLIALVPPLLAKANLGTAGRVAIGVLRFVLLFAGLLFGLAFLYRYAPDRQRSRWAWVSPGAVFAAVVWIVGSLLFSLYTANFGKYNETYGSLGAFVVLILWLLLTALVVILGAELNCELERQTFRDTTTGPGQPLGSRGAYAADTVAPDTDGDDAASTARAR
jgi:membrane protein